MMQVMALKVLREMAENIQNVDFYSIIYNEATNVKDVSELAVGWTTNWNNEFMVLKKMPNTDADSIMRELKDVLLRKHLKLNKCRGQWYDGCSTMSGSKSWVAVQIKSKEERALHTHCCAYSGNLAVGDMKKVCSVLKDTIDNTYELTNLVKIFLKM